MPATVRTSRRSCRSCQDASIRCRRPVTSFLLASSREDERRLQVTADLACSRDHDLRRIRLQVRVLDHEPLRPLLLEAHLHACVRAVAFDGEDDAFAELAVTHARAQVHTGRGGLLSAETADCDGARELHAGAHLFDQLLGHFFDEARGLSVAVGAVQPALLGAGKVELPHSARHADVAQASLLLEAVNIGERALMWEESILHAAHEDEREFEPLGRMQRHHLHAVLPGLRLAFAGFEHGMRKE